MLHFTSFTADWARALGKDFSASFEQRRNLVNTVRSNTLAFLADATRKRRHQAHLAAEGRRLFRSELRAGVHALRSRFAHNLALMSREFHATSEAFRNRSKSHGGAGSSFRRAQPEETSSDFAAAFDGRDGGTGARSSKKRHS
jgi:hypothetical protein